MSSAYAVITGATRGLGRTLVESFWNAGYSLYLPGRDLFALQEVKDGLSLRLSLIHI